MSYLDLIRTITSVAASSSVAAAIFNHLANRKRKRSVETVSRLVQVCGNGTKRPAVVRVLRRLELQGFGRLVVGRRGRDSRFKWAEI